MDYFAAEEERRAAPYRHDRATEAVLEEMNALLAGAGIRTAGNQAHPTVLVFGLPRSGTTLMYQLVCYSLGVGYPNNIVARFWDAPAYGVALSKAILADERDPSFASTYGQTPGLAGPHEFRFFWKRWLGLETMEDHLDFERHERADWEGLRAAIGSVQEAFGTAVAFKSLYFGQFVPSLLRAVDKPVLVYVEREPRDVALSILAARQAYYGDPGVWWSSFPPQYLALAEAPFAEQIAGQVHGLRRAYDTALDGVDPSLLVRVPYAQLCDDPSAVLERIRDAARRRFGDDIPLVNPPPDRFPRGAREPKDEAGRAVVAAVRAWAGGGKDS